MAEKKTYILTQHQGDFPFSQAFDSLADARSWPFFETDFPLEAEWECDGPHGWSLTHPLADCSFEIHERLMDAAERRRW